MQFGCGRGYDDSRGVVERSIAVDKTCEQDSLNIDNSITPYYDMYTSVQLGTNSGE